jgi:DNA-binding transcriptional regulator YiaG
MDTSREKPVGTDGHPYIWLRYTTQFNAGGRIHTLEMGVPVPVGASAEMREQLIREAEIGMEQLARRVEHRAAQIAQRSTRPPEPQRAQPPTPIRPDQASLQKESNRSATGSSTPVGAGTNTSAPVREGPQPLSLHEKQTAPAPVRQSGTVNMPVTPSIQGEANSNMKLSQFIQIIRDTLKLSPKEAMDLLNVKTLNGMNYRDALRKLQLLVEGNGGIGEKPATGGVPKTPAAIPAKPIEERAKQRTPPPQASQPKPPSSPRADVLTGPANIPVIPIKEEMIRETPKRVYKFDEEDEELHKEENNEEQKAIARIKLDDLKEIRGSSPASQGRFMVLQNVLNEQISDQELEYLIQHVWGVSGVKKLKVDQVEALISWAKEDFFVEEVEAVLALIDGEASHARSDR